MDIMRPVTKGKGGRPKGSKKVPGLCRHAASGRAYVTISGKPIYLGRHGTAEATDNYDRVVSEWLTQGRQRIEKGDALTINQMLATYWAHTMAMFHGNASTLSGLKSAIRLFRQYYGDTPVKDFGPLKLRALRDMMKKQPAKTKGVTWSRSTVNSRVASVVQIFKWACSHEMADWAQYHGMRTVEWLAVGDPTVRESKDVKPVDIDLVNRTVPYMTPSVRALVRVQLATGMRPGEAIRMRMADINTDGPTIDGVKLWVYSPYKHKSQHRGIERRIHLGVKSQEIMRPFLKSDPKDYIFNPDDDREWVPEVNIERERSRHKNRVARLGYMGSWRGKKKATTDPALHNVGRHQFVEPWRAHYNTSTYLQQVSRACDAANAHAHDLNPSEPTEKRLVPRWHVHQLRHNFATEVNRLFDKDTARVLLGHQDEKTTAIYAETDFTKAAKAMAAVG